MKISEWEGDSSNTPSVEAHWLGEPPNSDGIAIGFRKGCLAVRVSAFQAPELTHFANLLKAGEGAGSLDTAEIRPSDYSVNIEVVRQEDGLTEIAVDDGSIGFAFTLDDQERRSLACYIDGLSDVWLKRFDR